jgi:hypothetical protein
MIEAAEELGKNTGILKACQVLGVPRINLGKRFVVGASAPSRRA